MERKHKKANTVSDETVNKRVLEYALNLLVQEKKFANTQDALQFLLDAKEAPFFRNETNTYQSWGDATKLTRACTRAWNIVHDPDYKLPARTKSSYINFLHIEPEYSDESTPITKEERTTCP